MFNFISLFVRNSIGTNFKIGVMENLLKICDTKSNQFPLFFSQQKDCISCIKLQRRQLSAFRRFQDKSRYVCCLTSFIIIFFYKSRRKYWFHENFRFPIFDRFSRFGMSWTWFDYFWKMSVCLSVCVSVCVCVTKILWHV